MRRRGLSGVWSWGCRRGLGALVGAVRGSGLGCCELVDGRGVVGALGQDAGEGVG